MMFQPSGGGGGVNAWATGTPYVVGDIVSYGKNLYICIVAHTAAATIEADIGAGKWEIEVKPIKLQNLCLWGSTFEDNSVGGWTACGCATVTNGFPASVGSGGAAFSSSNGGRAKGANTTSPAIVSSGQINGQYSMNFATSGAGTIGDMYISSAYPVPIKYQSKVLSFEIAFKVVSGTPVMGGTSSDTYAVAIYDVANNAWIQPARCFSFTQSSGVGIASGSFQASSSMTSFQIAIYNPVAPTGASSLYFDDIYVGPQSVTWGVPVTDWVSYTPTITSGAGTIVSTLSGKWRRVGDSAQIQMSYVYSSGTGAAADFGLSLPSGFSMDTGKLTSTEVLGSGFYYSGPTGFLGTEVRYFTSTSVHFTKNAGAFIQGTDADDTAAAITVTITVPIVGWSSNTVMSSDADTRVVLAKATSSTTTIATTNTTVIMGAVTKDTHGAYNASTGIYTVPVTGDYRVKVYATVSSAARTANNGVALQVFKNSSANLFQIAYDLCQTSATTVTQLNGTLVVPNCVAGDTLYINGIKDTNYGTATLDGNATRNYVEFERISGPAQIAASETVSCRAYRSGSGVSVTAASNTELVFNSTSDDSHNGFNTTTGRYTAPISGRYLITTIVQITMGATAATDVETFVKINGGATYYAYDYTNSLANSKIYKWKASDVVRLLAGDYVSLFVNPTGQTVTVNHTGASNSVTEMTITRIGNY